MKLLRIVPIVVFWLLPAVLPAIAGDASADQLYAAGKFEAAAAGYAALLAANPSDRRAQLDLGAIRLYQNDLAGAEPLLRAVLAADPSGRAARLLSELERRKTEAGRRSTVDAAETIVPFVVSQPLPVVRLKANGKEGNFVVDTGGTLDLAPAFAASLGLQLSDGGMGVFAGGKRALVKKSMLTSAAVGGAIAYDMPVDVLDPRAAGMFGALHIDGVLGTTFFERFLVTMDFPKHRLIVRPRSREASARFQAAAAADGATIVPCWLVGDHLVFANARVNDVPGLFVFDSGLAGGGLMASKELVEAAHLQLDRAHAGTGMGGGGAVAFVPFVAGSVAVGNAVQRNVRGLYIEGGSPAFPFSVAGGISNEYLQHYAYTVDFDAMNIVLEPPTGAGEGGHDAGRR